MLTRPSGTLRGSSRVYRDNHRAVFAASVFSLWQCFFVHELGWRVGFLLKSILRIRSEDRD